ncbi:MAG TPA: hypothetical protein VGP13_02710 [Candidatus Paceibacterota bacterium]|jgi:hypothetical protein|nr:hypothetical protein [Candidatus Paceibacterota bacterium]
MRLFLFALLCALASANPAKAIDVALPKPDEQAIFHNVVVCRETGEDPVHVRGFVQALADDKHLFDALIESQQAGGDCFVQAVITFTPGLPALKPVIAKRNDTITVIVAYAFHYGDGVQWYLILPAWESHEL